MPVACPYCISSSHTEEEKKSNNECQRVFLKKEEVIDLVNIREGLIFFSFIPILNKLMPPFLTLQEFKDRLSLSMSTAELLDRENYLRLQGYGVLVEYAGQSVCIETNETSLRMFEERITG